ncbi:MAG: glycerol-3-phosphate 1-O-acyltransferase PlsY [Alistipes sp.]|nr:glycerol-3-phosphate 1-O-acyltransferase PlsY [Alistipes sp.]
MFVTVILVICAYLLGSIPSAVWIGKKFYATDVREHGSRNAGATNTLRVLGPKAALPVFAMDVAKGFAAVQLFRLSPLATTGWEFYVQLALVLAVVTGHIFPVFAGFRGGKGVATIAGSVLAVYPPAVLLCLLTFVIMLAITSYVSLSSMTAGVLFPIYTRFVFGVHYLPLIIFGCVVALLLIWTHRKNIGRLLSGTESKIRIVRKKEAGA